MADVHAATTAATIRFNGLDLIREAEPEECPLVGSVPFANIRSMPLGAQGYPSRPSSSAHRDAVADANVASTSSAHDKTARRARR